MKKKSLRSGRLVVMVVRLSRGLAVMLSRVRIPFGVLMKKIKAINILKALKSELPLKKILYKLFISQEIQATIKMRLHIRSHINFNQMNKIYYDNIDKANDRAKLLSNWNKKNFVAYKCLFCNGFHIGENKWKGSA